MQAKYGEKDQIVDMDVSLPLYWTAPRWVVTWYFLLADVHPRCCRTLRTLLETGSCTATMTPSDTPPCRTSSLSAQLGPWNEGRFSQHCYSLVSPLTLLCLLCTLRLWTVVRAYNLYPGVPSPRGQ